MSIVFTLKKEPRYNAYRPRDFEVVYVGERDANLSSPTYGSCPNERPATQADRAAYLNEWWLLDNEFIGSEQTPLAMLLLVEPEYTPTIDYFTMFNLNSIEYVATQETKAEAQARTGAGKTNFTPIVHQDSTPHADYVITLCREYLAMRKGHAIVAQSMREQALKDEQERKQRVKTWKEEQAAKDLPLWKTKAGQLHDPQTAYINAMGESLSHTIKSTKPLTINTGVAVEDPQAAQIAIRTKEDIAYYEKHKKILDNGTVFPRLHEYDSVQKTGVPLTPTKEADIPVKSLVQNEKGELDVVG